MKKVAIVSCYFKENYGSMLQAYATQKVLDNNNILNETIDIEKNIDFKNGKKRYYKTQVFNFKFIKTKFGMIKLKIDKKINKKLGENIAIRNNKYKSFKQEFNLSVACKNYKDLSKLAEKKYTDVIIGSDQLWLPVNVVADYYTLNWVPEKINKISYATSFGISEVPKKYNELYYNFLKRIEHLSVREQTGVDIIKKISGVDAKLVSDPTLLLSEEEWEQEIISDRIIKDKYIFCYFLGNNIEHRKFVERLKEKTGCKIVSINHCDEYVKYNDKFCDYAPYDVGPREWINLVKNADYVCTDSFHGTVFSIIFNKIFYDFRRHKNSNKMSTNSRIDNLLNIAGISNERILIGTENVEDVLKYKIDYDEVNKNIDKFRNDSKQWLLNSISWKEEKKNHIEILDKGECCGCTACKSICPHQAIEMVSDEEGFLYPKIDEEKCIECGACKKVCPIINKQHIGNFKQKAYLFQNNNQGVREDSTSGGFFSAIGEYVINNGGVVFGASYDENFKVIHSEARTISELKKFRKSKYVQSDITDVFSRIKKYLNQGIVVCFSGTPCQVAGLKKFLIKEYENLILVDLMCHSVPSPLYFEKYKQYILNKLNATKIEDINFRDKKKYGYKYSMMTVKTDNGVYSQGIDTDPYLRAFFDDYSVRPSCYECKFKTQRRVSDFTIWDCFNINEIDKSFDDDKGTTRILIQSMKGEEIIHQLKNIKLKEIEVNIATKKVREMTNSVSYNIQREKFFKDINDEDLIEKYFPITLKTRLNSFVRKSLSVTGLYSSVKSLAKKVLGK